MDNQEKRRRQTQHNMGKLFEDYLVSN